MDKNKKNENKGKTYHSPQLQEWGTISGSTNEVGPSFLTDSEFTGSEEKGG